MEDSIELQTLCRNGEAHLLNCWNNHTSKSSVKARRRLASYASVSVKPTQPAWFDMRVFYVRASSCIPNEAPDSLLIVYLQRNINAELEVNGARISPTERTCFVLRRDRVDARAAETTYVSTNNLRTTGDLAFEIYDKDVLIIYGTLRRSATTLEQELTKDGDVFTASTPCYSNEAGWSMECACGISSHACFFLKGRNPTMEVYVAGQSYGSPLALMTTVQLTARKRRQFSLDVIPEVEESQPNQIIARQIAEDAVYAKMVGHPLCSFYMPIGEAYIGEGEEEGELSWFNAGVRVGVGIGLGLCLGAGIGVGLLVRPFKRRLL